MISFSADSSRLTQRIHLWSKAAGVSLREGLMFQAGKLKEDLVQGAPPRSKSKSIKRAKKDVAMQFSPLPRKIFRDGRANGRLRWLYAGKSSHGRFLVGVEQENFKPDLTAADLVKLRSQLKGRQFGNRFQEVGQRGKENPFKIQKLNRIAVKKTSLSQLVKSVMDRFGLLKASWAVDWSSFGVKRSLPAWIAKHISKGQAKGRNILKLTGDRPSIQIISNATGVEHERSKANVRRAVRKRASAIARDMKLYLSGVKKQAGFKNS